MANGIYSTGTATVVAGGKTVTLVGAIVNGINFSKYDTIEIGDGSAMVLDVDFVGSKLTITPWPGSSQTNQAYQNHQSGSLRYDDVKVAENLRAQVSALNTQGFYVFVPPGATEPDPSLGDEGQYAFQADTGKLWQKVDGLWSFIGVYKGVSPRGEWSDVTAYVVNDSVSHDGASYIAIASNTNSEPPSADWMLLGTAGAAATVDVGTTTTLAPGEDATVTPSGTSNARVLNFGIPTGKGYGGTSTTSMTIATGNKTFTTQSGLAFVAGDRVHIGAIGSELNWMEGFVTNYVGTLMTVTVSDSDGSGTFASWGIGLTGKPGTGDGDMKAEIYDSTGVNADAFDSVNHAFIADVTGAVARNSAAKMRDVLSVQDFGAKGDGATNDTLAFKAAAAVGGEIHVPPGTYMLDYINGINKRVQWVLADGAVLKQRVPANPSTTLDQHWGIFEFVAGSEGWSVTGGTLDGNRSVLAPYYNGHTRLGQDNHWWGIRSAYVNGGTIKGTKFRNFMNEAFYSWGGNNFRAEDVDIQDCGVAFVVQGDSSVVQYAYVEGRGKNIGNVVDGTAYYIFQHGCTFAAFRGGYCRFVMDGFCGTKPGSDGDTQSGGKEPVPSAYGFYSLDRCALYLSVFNYTPPDYLAGIHEAFNFSSVNHSTGVLVSKGLEHGLAANSSNHNTFDLDLDGEYVSVASYSRNGLLATIGGVFPVNESGLAGETTSTKPSSDNVFRGTVRRFGINIRDEGINNHYLGVIADSASETGFVLTGFSGSTNPFPKTQNVVCGSRRVVDCSARACVDAGLVALKGQNDVVTGCNFRGANMAMGASFFGVGVYFDDDTGNATGLTRFVDNEVDNLRYLLEVQAVSYKPGTCTPASWRKRYDNTQVLGYEYKFEFRNPGRYVVGMMVQINGVLAGGLNAAGKIVDIFANIVTIAFRNQLTFVDTYTLRTLKTTGAADITGTITNSGTTFNYSSHDLENQIDFRAYLKRGAEYAQFAYFYAPGSTVQMAQAFASNGSLAQTQVILADVESNWQPPKYGYQGSPTHAGTFLLKAKPRQSVADLIPYQLFDAADVGSEFEVAWTYAMDGSTLSPVLVWNLPDYYQIQAMRVEFDTAITGVTSGTLIVINGGAAPYTALTGFSSLSAGTVTRAVSPNSPALISGGSNNIQFISQAGYPVGTITLRALMKKIISRYD